MGKSIMAIMVMATVLSCASHQKRPELARLLENSSATWKVDVLPAGHGSGVVVHEDGYILTCHHVAGEGQRELRITIAENGGEPQTYVATVIAHDENLDLAVVKVDHAFAHPVVVAEPDGVFEGDNVYNIGFPYRFGKLIGRGYVAKTHFNYTRGSFVITNGLALDIPDGPGTSGSGIYSVRNGELVGIMKLMLWDSVPGVPPTLVKVATGPDDIRKFLEASGIPYHRHGDNSGWKLNMSAPTAPYQIDISVPPQH